jgi:zinc protease
VTTTERPAYNYWVATVLGLFGSTGVAEATVSELHSFRIDNGLTVLHSPRADSPLVSVQAWVGVGAADELASEAGLAHVVEHMLFKGTHQYGVGELTATMERAGGELNAWTSFDHTVFHGVAARRDLDTAVRVIADTLIHPRFSEEDLENERKVILSELRHNDEDRDRAAFHALFRHAFMVHPYRRPIIGTAASVARFHTGQVADFHQRWYRAANTVLVVVGDCDRAEVRRAVIPHFSRMRGGTVVRAAHPEPAQNAPRVVVTERAGGENYVAAGIRVPAAGDPASAGLDMLAVILAQGDSSRLVRELRDQREVVTSVGSYQHLLGDAGMFITSAVPSSRTQKDALQVVSALSRGLAGLGKEISDGEMTRARAAAHSDRNFHAETVQATARKLGWYASWIARAASTDMSLAERVRHYERSYFDAVERLTRHDLRHLARAHLRADAATFSLLLAGKSGAHLTVQVAKKVRGAMASAAAAPAPAPAVVRRVLPSGVVVLVKPDPSVDMVSMRALWRGGSRLEHEGNAGATTLLARLITQGCGELDAATTARAVDDLGGVLEGTGGRNSFGLRAEWLGRNWKDGFSLLADCVTRPRFDGLEVSRQIRRQMEDLSAAAVSPTQVAFRLFSEALYQRHPYRLDPLGSSSSLAAMSREQLRSYYDASYPASGMTLAIVGNVDPEDAIALVAARFGQVRRAVPATPSIPVESFDGRPPTQREVYAYLDRQQSHLVVGFPGGRVADPQRFALEVLTAVLGGQGGRLFVAIRDRHGLAYRVSAHAVDGVDPGYVAIYVACDPVDAPRVLELIREQLESVVQHGISDDELERARRYLIGAHDVAMQRRSAVANALAYHEAHELGWQEWSRYPEHIAEVDAAEVTAAAAAYLRWDRAVIATVRPPGFTPGATRRMEAPASSSKRPAHPTKKAKRAKKPASPRRGAR